MINQVLMTQEEIQEHITGSVLPAAHGNLWYVCNNGRISYGNACFGIRPVVSLTSGVYIKSGTGTESDPYILGKDE